MRQTTASPSIPPALLGEAGSIGAFLGTQALGNFVMQSLYAATIAKMLSPACGLKVTYRNDRPYKDLIIRLLRAHFLDRAPFGAVSLNKGDPQLLDWFDPEADPDNVPAVWQDNDMGRPRFFIMPSMTSHPGNLPGIIALRFPEDEDADWTERLTRMGVQPDKWFVTLHMRQLEYQFRYHMDGIRCVDTTTYIDAIRLVLAAGGQVVRIGDPSMTPLPKMRGLIDLSRVPNSFELQCYAINRARFHFGTDSGPSQIAGAFKTPTLITNAMGLSGMNTGDVALAKRRRFPNGNILGSKGLLDIGAFTLDSLYLEAHIVDVEMIDNTADELSRAATFMLESTADCLGWRGYREDDPLSTQGRIDWPIPYSSPRTIVIE
jgi:putative glycosyltransferase (TIGR04372 family)